jgi:hypothetical protein
MRGETWLSEIWMTLNMMLLSVGGRRGYTIPEARRKEGAHGTLG